MQRRQKSLQKAIQQGEEETTEDTTATDEVKADTDEDADDTQAVITVEAEGKVDSVQKGSTLQFHAVIADGEEPEVIEWSLDGDHADGTKIEGGLLTVAEGETAETITVKATATVNGTEASGTVTVTVTDAANEPVAGTKITVQLSEKTNEYLKEKIDYAITPGDSGWNPEAILDDAFKPMNAETIEAETDTYVTVRVPKLDDSIKVAASSGNGSLDEDAVRAGDDYVYYLYAANDESTAVKDNVIEVEISATVDVEITVDAAEYYDNVTFVPVISTAEPVVVTMENQKASLDYHADYQVQITTDKKVAVKTVSVNGIGDKRFTALEAPAGKSTVQLSRTVTADRKISLGATVEVNRATANHALFQSAEDSQYRVTINDDNADKAGKGIWTAKDSIRFTVTPNEGYTIDKVEKIAGEETEAISNTNTNIENGAFIFDYEFTDADASGEGAQRQVTFNVTASAKVLESDGGKVQFAVNQYTAEKLGLEVTEVENKVVKTAENEYEIKKDAQYVEFKLTKKEGVTEITPIVMVGDNEWAPLKEEEAYVSYRVSASLFTEGNTTIAIGHEVKLSAVYSPDEIDSMTPTIIGDGEIREEGNWSGETTYYWILSAGTRVKLNAQAFEGCEIVDYKIGPEKEQPVNKDSFITEEIIVKDDTTITVSSKTLYTPYLYEADNRVEGNNGIYTVQYGKSYNACVIKGAAVDPVQLARAELTGAAADGSTATVSEESNTSAAVRISDKDAGKELTLKLYEKDGSETEPIAVYTLNVNKAATKVAIAGVKNGKLTQTVDTVQTYALTLTPRDADISSLKVETTGLPAGASAAIVDNVLEITTPAVKDETVIEGYNSAGPVIKLVDKTTGNAIADGEIAFTFSAPATLLNATPSVSLKYSSDVDLTLALGASKVAEPNTGKLWYAVTVDPQETAADIKAKATYYREKTGDTQTENIVVSTADLGKGTPCKFNVTVQLIQTMDSAAPTGASSANLTTFASKEKALNGIATKNPYYETKLSLKKGTTTLYTGQQDVKIATLSFGKNTTYTGDVDVVDITDDVPYVYEKDGDVYMSVPTYWGGDYEWVSIGKHTIRVSAKAPAETNVAYADIVVTVNRGIEVLELTSASDTIYKAANKAASLKVTPLYNYGYTGIYAPKAKKVANYTLVQAEYGEYEDEYGDEHYGYHPGSKPVDSSVATVKNGTISVNKAYTPNESTNKFYVRAEANDWKGNPTAGYSRMITVSSEAMKLGEVVIVKRESKLTSDDYGDEYYVNQYTVVTKGNEAVTSGELKNTFVRVLKDGTAAEEGKVYTDEDFVNTANLSYKSSNAKALAVSAYGQLTAGKAGKNIKITVTANDGSNSSKTLEKLEIENAKPEELGLKVEKYITDGNGDGYVELNKDGQYGLADVAFTDTADSTLRLTVMRKVNGRWVELDELTDLKVTIGKAKILNKASAYNQRYTIVANQPEAAVTLVCNGKTWKFTIKNSGVKTAKTDAAPGVKTTDTLRAGYYENVAADGYDQTITYTLNVKTDDIPKWAGMDVMVKTDATDRSNVKNTSRYEAFEARGLEINSYTTVGEQGTFTLHFDTTEDRYDEEADFFNYRPQITAGNYKLQLTFGKLAADGRSFNPATKPITVTLKAVAAKKSSYKPVTAVKMSLLDTAAGRKLAGTGKEINDECYYRLLNANITGQANHFIDLFELDNDNNLRLKSTFSADLMKAIGADSKAGVIEYITGNTPEAKNDRIGYVTYEANGNDGAYYSGTTKLTVTIDSKNTTDKFTLANATVMTNTDTVKVSVLKNKQTYTGGFVAICIDTENSAGNFVYQSVSDGKIVFSNSGDSLNKGKYKVTLYAVPMNSYYADEVKNAAEEAKKNLTMDHGVKLTTTITVSEPNKTGSKITVAKNDLSQTFTNNIDGDSYYYTAEDGKGKYIIRVPFAKNMMCNVASIVSKDKFASDKQSALIGFEVESQNDDSGWIKIILDKKAFDEAVSKNSKVKYSTSAKNAVLSVAATVNFGQKPSGEGAIVADADIKTENITFKLTMPKQAAALAEIQKEIADNKWIKAEAEAMAWFYWGTKSTESLKNDLTDSVLDSVRKRIASDSGITASAVPGSITLPRDRMAGSLPVTVTLRVGEETETAVITLKLPALNATKTAMETSVRKFIAAKENMENPWYVSTINSKYDIERDVRKAAGLDVTESDVRIQVVLCTKYDLHYGSIQFYNYKYKDYEYSAYFEFPYAEETDPEVDALKEKLDNLVYQYMAEYKHVEGVSGVAYNDRSNEFVVLLDESKRSDSVKTAGEKWKNDRAEAFKSEVLAGLESTFGPEWENIQNITVEANGEVIPSDTRKAPMTTGDRSVVVEKQAGETITEFANRFYDRLNDNYDNYLKKLDDRLQAESNGLVTINNLMFGDLLSASGDIRITVNFTEESGKSSAVQSYHLDVKY